MNNETAAAAITLGSAMYTIREYEATYLFFKQNLDMQMLSSGMLPQDMMADAEKKNSYYGMISSKTVQHLVLAATLENLFREEGLSLDNSALNTMLEDSESSMGGSENLNSMLTQFHMDREMMKKLILVPELMIRQLCEAFRTSRTAEMDAMFESKYLRAKHILLKEDAGSSSRQAEAIELVKQARAGADFDALIAQHGEDPGMKANPDGYVFPEGRMVREFYDSTKALELNAVSEPVRTLYGWHIIQRLPLDEKIRQAHAQEIEQSYIGTVLDAWLAAHEPVINPELQKINAETIQDPA